MSANDVIKNPNRSKNNKAISYVPNYIKLNKEPFIMKSETSFPDSSSEEVSSVDGVDIDINGNEIYTSNTEVIDNNEFVNLDPINDPVINKEVRYSEAPPEKEGIIDIGQYILIVKEQIITKGALNIIEDNVKSILYGEHPAFSSPIDISDVVILKRIGIKFGVFLEE